VDEAKLVRWEDVDKLDEEKNRKKRGFVDVA
jgi:U3 small nucleolar RNA-associated protein 12